MSRDEFNKIMSNEIGESVGFLISFNVLKDYTNISLTNNAKDNTLIYKASVDDIINRINEEELTTVRNGGWTLSEDRNFIVKLF